MDIQLNTETVVKKTYLLTLTEEELTAALVDARPLQRELRKARAAGQPQRATWSRTGRAAVPKAPEKNRPGRPKPNPPRPAPIRSVRTATTPSSAWPNTCPPARIGRSKSSRRRTSRATSG